MTTFTLVEFLQHYLINAKVKVVATDDTERYMGMQCKECEQQLLVGTDVQESDRTCPTCNSPALEMIVL
jgi:Zn finger protein HypA/HybF involved in hydrogenase expression